MNQKNVKWLYEQLPELVEKKIIPAESVELIRSYYGAVDKNLGSRTMLTMFGIIGVVLVGLGMILILAHNWENLDRMTRTLMIVGKLLTAQIIVGAVIWFKKDQAAWTESASTFLMLIIGASIALIGQTYHIADDFSSFILTWMLLSIPLVYIMKVTTPALLYLIGITIWVVSVDNGVNKHFIWPLLSLSGFYYWQLLKRNRYANPAVLLSWFFTLCFYTCFGKAFAIHLQSLSVLVYATLFAITYFIGLIWFDDPEKNWKKPFKIIGLAGSISVSFLLTTKNVWKSIGWGLDRTEMAEAFLLGSLMVIALLLIRIVMKKKIKRNILFGIAPVVAGFGLVLLYFDRSGINATVLMNAYVLSLSVMLILRGVREGSLGVLNIGMLMVAAMMIMRFFDSNFSFVVRGLAFVVMGSCFLVTNWIMVRRKKEVSK